MSNRVQVQNRIVCFLCMYNQEESCHKVLKEPSSSSWYVRSFKHVLCVFFGVYFLLSLFLCFVFMWKSLDGSQEVHFLRATSPKTKKTLWSSLTCQEPLWSFSSGRQTGRWSSRSRWRHCRSHHASWGKHQSHFLRGTSRCPWTPLGHNGKTVVGGGREEIKL